jgi:hypothetical protein
MSRSLATGPFIMDRSASTAEMRDSYSPATIAIITAAEDQARELSAAQAANFARIQMLGEEKQNEQTKLSAYERDIKLGGMTHDQDTRKAVAAIEKRIERITAEQKRLQAKNTGGKGTIINLAALHEFEEDNSGKRFQRVEVVGQVPAGETHETVVAQIRERLEANLTERAALAKLPLPHSDVIAAMEAEIDALAVAGRVDVGPLFRVHRDERGRESTQGLAWPMTSKFERGIGDDFAPVDVLKLREIFVFFGADQIKGVLRAEIMKRPERDDALSQAERIEKRKALDAERMRLNHEEEYHLRQIDSETGEFTPRRMNAEIPAILGIELVK